MLNIQQFTESPRIWTKNNIEQSNSPWRPSETLPTSSTSIPNLQMLHAVGIIWVRTCKTAASTSIYQHLPASTSWLGGFQLDHVSLTWDPLHSTGWRFHRMILKSPMPQENHRTTRLLSPIVLLVSLPSWAQWPSTAASPGNISPRRISPGKP